MIKFTITTNSDLKMLVNARLNSLKAMNYSFNDSNEEQKFIESNINYFKNGNHTTVIAIEEKHIIGCATLCYYEIIPSFKYPTGKHAVLMNVYTDNSFRRRGIASEMINILIADAKKKGVSEISLDASVLGEPLYKHCGFIKSNNRMTLIL